MDTLPKSLHLSKSTLGCFKSWCDWGDDHGKSFWVRSCQLPLHKVCLAKKSAMIDLIPGSMAMFMLPVSALDVAGIERKLLQTMEMITAKKRKVGLTQSDER